MILSVRGKTPQLGDNIYIAPNATIIGDVEIGENSSVWFNAVIRGDVNSIKIGNKVNVQDGVIIHCTYQKTTTTIGNNVSIGHNAVIHGCTIQDNVLVGIGAIIMDGCIVHSNAIIAAGAVVLKNTIVEEGSIYGGVPAQKIKEISPNLIEHEIERIADSYLIYADWYKEVKTVE
ncbi:gamma carbonic anhydrase family protein [Arachidicoccus sp.]|jgi:carbonic anhydrase/acetyltransferase-like protein (isoleucine patch superfamily)|uniref:gamma carbonic anhydrase family protein n=1 Tax=Arachidicoccus sp. TaxID=1872624 RepID=UPI003D1B6CE7